MDADFEEFVRCDDLEKSSDHPEGVRNICNVKDIEEEDVIAYEEETVQKEESILKLGEAVEALEGTVTMATRTSPMEEVEDRQITEDEHSSELFTNLNTVNQHKRTLSLDINWNLENLGHGKRRKFSNFENSKWFFPRQEQSIGGNSSQRSPKQGYSRQEPSKQEPWWKELREEDFSDAGSSFWEPSVVKSKRWPKFQHSFSGSMNDLVDNSSPNLRPSKFGLGRLQLLAKKESDEIVDELTNKEDEFLDLLKTELSVDEVMIFAEILAKMTTSKMLKSKCSLITKFFQPEVLQMFSEHSDNIYAKDLEYSDAEVISYFLSLAIFFNHCIEILPNSAMDYSKDHLKKIMMSVQNLRKFKQLHVLEKLEHTFTNLLFNLTSLESSAKTCTPKKSKSFQNLEWRPCRTDFREVNPYPVPEDLLVKSEAQLSPVVVEGPYNNVEHYLNVQFYLLREDFIIPLRNGVLNFFKLKSAKKSTFRRTENVRFYRDVQFTSQFVDGNMLVSEVFFGPKGKYRNINWKNTKKFMYGSLVCFSSDSFKSLFIGVIVNRDVNLLQKGILRCELLGEIEERNLFGKKFIMAESEVYFEAYHHVLNALKTFNETNFPLKEYIIDVSSEKTLPCYLAADLDMRYNFNGFQFKVVDKSTWPSKELLKVNDSQFDALYSALTQKLAIIQGPPGTGKTYLGLIIAKILNDNEICWRKDKFSPILVVCYTNHALDQFLEGILSYTKKVVRVGGQSRNEKMAPYNLKNLQRGRSTSIALSDIELHLRKCAADIHVLNCFLQELKYRPGILSLKYLEPQMTEIHSFWFHQENSLLVEWLLEGASENQVFDTVIPALPDPVDISDYAITLKQLLCHINDNDSEIKNSAENGSEELLRKKQLLVSRLSYCKSKLMMDIDWDDELILQLNEVSDLSQLDPDDRWILYSYWISGVVRLSDEEMTVSREEYCLYAKRKSEMANRINLKIMKEADFVGITTTGAARQQALLQELGAKIVIVEEAAEVMESHVVVSLSSKCEHLILIGDHKQLRPSPAVYKLAKEYNFDVSLFERMLRNNVPYNTLHIQHRMRPEIADLIIPAVYPALQNHETVLQYEHILGIERNLFFINHSYPEEQVEFCLSKRNAAEAGFLIALCRHIILQGYHPKQITILTFYLGQMFTLIEEREKHSKMTDVKIACVDNYQGEENDIILLSLVRSNEEGKIGFLISENRICVALSRAKKALYVIGNMDLVASKSMLWKRVLEVLKKKRAIGSKLKLKCYKHPHELTEVCKREDFVPITEGGCTLLCNTDLSCGHICKRICHLNSHDTYKCKEICEKEMCAYRHKCKELCFQDCGECMVPLYGELPCGHWANVPCCVDPLEHKCNVVVTVILQPCGHEIKKKCFEDVENIKCTWSCKSRLPCGHACRLKCHIGDDPDHNKYKCLRPCGRKKVNCKQEHFCEKKCFEECSPCTSNVKRKLPNCDHFHTMECSTDAASIVCDRKCYRMLECGHLCPLRCFEKCGGCKVMVVKKIEECNHEVNIECSLAPERKFCNDKCESFLPCGHKCEMLCKEPCQPNSCKVLVEEMVESPCGHQVRLYCHESWFGVEASTLPRRCLDPCSKTLLCEHNCKGTCGSCFQGRIHLQCQEKCGRALICGHECKVSCSKSCPPCKKKCYIQCEHSECGKECGNPCEPCMEPCTWKCKHYRCNKACGQMCDRPPCDEPCEKDLCCGHPCIGLCGEKCPPLCRVCDALAVEEISSFLPSEDEIPRFLLLPDCNHVFDVKGLDTWLLMKTGCIKMVSCPQCKTPIQNAIRYGNIVKQHVIEVSKVKTKVFGDVKKSRQNVLTDFQKLMKATKTMGVNHSSSQVFKILNLLLRNVMKKINIKKELNVLEANAIQARMQFTTVIVECLVNLPSASYQPSDSNLMTHFTYATKLIKTILGNLESISHQQRSDFFNECQRFQLRMQLCLIESMPQFNFRRDAAFLKTYGECKSLITSLKPFQSDLYNETLIKLEQLQKNLGRPIGIPKLEMESIVKAINLHQGHWYTCPNGHVYVIGDCGQAMQQSRCNECGEQIGGGSHRHLSTNTRLNSLPEGL